MPEMNLWNLGLSVTQWLPSAVPPWLREGISCSCPVNPRACISAASQAFDCGISFLLCSFLFLFCTFYFMLSFFFPVRNKLVFPFQLVSDLWESLHKRDMDFLAPESSASIRITKIFFFLNHTKKLMFLTPWLCVVATGKNYLARTVAYVVSL